MRCPKGPLFFLTVLMLVLSVSCGPQGTSTNGPPTPSAARGPVSIDGVEFQLQRALFRISYQTYYLMFYPDEGSKFLQVVARIHGPDDPLEWGSENISAGDGDGSYPLVQARPVLVGDDIEYRVGEDFQFEYEFFFEVPVEASGAELRLELPQGHSLALEGLVEERQIAAPNPAPGEILSGESNQALGELAVIGGGSDNRTMATHSGVFAGRLNLAGGDHTVVAGGRENQTHQFASAVSGGYGNSALGRESAVAGGSRNTAESRYSSVGGGIQNTASGSSSTVAGGANNTTDAIYAAVSGGTRNQASGDSAAVGGGTGNTASGNQSVVLGGLANQAQGDYSAVLGGYGSLASGEYAIAVGGESNRAAGDWSLAAGRGASVAAAHPGAILLADSIESSFQSQAGNEFAVRATGGVRLVTAVGTDGDPLAGVVLPAGSGSWAIQSDVNAKTAFAEVEPGEILAGLNSMPISIWSYVSQDGPVRHLGPSAQDFHAAFGLGEDPRHINVVDADGVALAGIQALSQQAQRDRETIESLEERIVALEAGRGRAGAHIPAAPLLPAAVGLAFLLGWQARTKFFRYREH